MASSGPKELNKEFWSSALSNNDILDDRFWLVVMEENKPDKILKSLSELSSNELDKIMAGLTQTYSSVLNNSKGKMQNQLNKYGTVIKEIKELKGKKEYKPEYNAQLIQYMNNEFKKYNENVGKSKPTFQEAQQMRVFLHTLNGYKEDSSLDPTVKEEANRILAKIPPPVPPRKPKSLEPTAPAITESAPVSTSPQRTRPLPVPEKLPEKPQGARPLPDPNNLPAKPRSTRPLPDFNNLPAKLQGARALPLLTKKPANQSKKPKTDTPKKPPLTESSDLNKNKL